MSCILYIETSTSVCSVAVSHEGHIIYDQLEKKGPRQATILAPMVRDALSFADSHAIPLDYVALSSGPGSYTGLRIGSSTAKGVCYGRNVKLVSVQTLKLLTVPLLLYHDEIEENALFCPMIDARRMEVYTAVYDRALKEIRPTEAVIVEKGTFDDLLEKQPVYFFGNGAEKCETVIAHSNAHFVKGIIPEARNMLPLAQQSIAKGEFEDVAYFEPYYLKEFIATTPKKLL